MGSAAWLTIIAAARRLGVSVGVYRGLKTGETWPWADNVDAGTADAIGLSIELAEDRAFLGVQRNSARRSVTT
jgi:hypothetical protein